MLWLRLGLAVIALCVGSGAARAQDDSPRTLASKEFQRGLALAKNGDLDAARDAFESAYRASPHHAVLYNLGQAYIGLGKPVEALDTLERFLREGGTNIKPERRSEVEALVERQRERIGFVDLSVQPDGAEVFVDGKSLGPAPVAGKLGLAAGHHVVAARKQSYSSRLASVELPAMETVRVSLILEAESKAMTEVAIACELPGVEVSVDGSRRGMTPLTAPLLIPAGTRTVRFTRAGYRPFETSVDVSNGRTARIACSMPVDLAGMRGGRLNVSVSEPFARVSVDGVRYRGALLPPGPHVVRVSRSGFRAWSRVMEIEPGGNHSVAAILEPTPDHRAELEAEAHHRRTLAVGFGAAGVALVGTSVGLFVWNSGRYDDWRGEGVDASHAADIQRVDDFAIGTAVTGAAALVTAAVLWLTSGP